MNYKVLYRKYRPNDFDGLIGQDYTKTMLMNVISSGKIGHAYIFTGPRGTGKTSSAKLFAKAINCLDENSSNPCGVCENCKDFNISPDIIEIDAASNNGVEEMRELIENVKLSPSSLKYKVYIIDEVHMLSTSAFNALLLTLEEPPSHVVFILATTDIQKVPITILSRCQRFDFRPIDNVNITNRIKYVAGEENIDIDEEAIKEIVYIAAGGMRDALSILDQLASNTGKITLDNVISNFGTISNERISDFITKFMNDDIQFTIDFLTDVKEKGIYYSVFLEKLIEELRNVAISIKQGEIDFNFDVIYRLIFDLNECLSNININVNPYTLIEIVFLRAINGKNNSFNGAETRLNNPNECIAVDAANPSEMPLKNAQKDDAVASSILRSESIKKLEESFVDKVEMQSEIINEIVTTDDSKDIISNINEDNKKNNEELKSTKTEEIDDTFKKIRINNCFAGVNKTYKISYTEKWNELLDYLSINDRYLMSLVADSMIQAASDKYIIINSKVDSTNHLINNSIKKIEELFTRLFSIDIKLVSLTNNEWDVAKNDYIAKTKANYSYSLIDEEFEEDLIEENDELEKLAFEIFGSNNIEFE